MAVIQCANCGGVTLESNRGSVCEPGLMFDADLQRMQPDHLAGLQKICEEIFARA